MFKDILEKSRNEKEILSLYTNKEDTERFSVGYILELCEKYCIIALISPSGLYDGYRVIDINEIYKIEYGGDYEKKLKKLYDIKKQSHKDIKLLENNLIISMLKFAKENEFIITIELLESGLNDVQGYVKNFTDEKLMILKINDLGQKDGLSEIDLDAITSIVCNSEDENTLEILAEIN